MTNSALTINGKASLHGSFDRKRLGVIPAILLGACVIPATGANAAGCDPGPGQVTFYSDTFYQGACWRRDIGDYPNSKALKVKNDSISSIKVGSGINVTVCKHAAKGNVRKHFTNNPQCQTYTKDEPTFKGNRVGNDSITSASIYRGKRWDQYPTTSGACKPKAGQLAIAVYEHINYRGKCRLLTLGNYLNSKQINFKNDSISSIEFDPKSEVRIYIFQHSNKKGRREYISKSAPSLYHSRVGDNAISSIFVYRKK